jgi:hypothetical protein
MGCFGVISRMGDRERKGYWRAKRIYIYIYIYEGIIMKATSVEEEGEG